MSRELKAPTKIVIIVLALLQLIAPLVHAHRTVDRSSVTGLHVPGLELFSAGQDSPELQALVRVTTIGNQIIEIDSGLRMQAGHQIPYPLDKGFYVFCQSGFPSFHGAFNRQVNFSPHRIFFPPTLFTLKSLAPRAPPLPA